MKRPDKRPDTWMPLYVADYLKDTGHLSAAEHGAYLLLIMQAWTRGGSLPTDVERLRLMCRLDREEWDRAKDAVLPFFYIDEDCYRHKRVDRELTGATQNIQQRRTAGLASAEARKRQREATGVPTKLQRAFNGSVNETPNETPTGVPTKLQRAFNGSVNETPNETPTGVPTKPSTEVQREGRPSPSPISKKETSLRDAKKVGSRIPEDWTPGPEGALYARRLGLDPKKVFTVFQNYWMAKAGKDAVKLDWSKVWQNWCLKEAERSGSSPPVVLDLLPPRDGDAYAKLTGGGFT